MTEILLNSINSLGSPTTSNISSPASSNSNESYPSNTVILYAEKSNEIILNINDIGMECLKNQINSNSANESCIDLETEYDSDDDVVSFIVESQNTIFT